MNVRILKVLSMIFIILLFSGCSEKIIYVDRPIEVKVPVQCKVPKIHCNFNKQTDTEVIIALRTCIQDLIESTKVCQ